MGTYNTSTLDFRHDDSFWNLSIETSRDPQTFTTINMWENNVYLEFMPCGIDVNQIYFWLYNESGLENFDTITYFDQPSDPALINFRKNASLFDLKRVRCHGTWEINSTTIILADGKCGDDDVGQKIVNNTRYSGLWPFPTDALPTVTVALVPGGQSFDWPCLNATYSMAVVTSYWTRAVFMLNKY